MPLYPVQLWTILQVDLAIQKGRPSRLTACQLFITMYTSNFQPQRVKCNVRTSMSKNVVMQLYILQNTLYVTPKVQSKEFFGSKSHPPKNKKYLFHKMKNKSN